ncbi:MAG: DUF4870 domain-containing protein [Aggregatilineales bacterium]
MNDEIKQPTGDTSEDRARVTRLTASTAADSASAEDSDAVIREYESRYRPMPEENPAADRPARRQMPRQMPRSYSTLRVSDDERLWATVAHASVWVTVLGGLFTIGAIIPVSIFLPLVIYFMFRKRSDYVAFHALQAFVIQLAGTVGAFALLTVGGLVWVLGMVIALLAMVILIGFILVPVWGIVGIVLAIFVLLLPVAMVLFGTIAAIETMSGRDYRYPLIARWVDRQLAGGYLHTV